MSKIKNARLDQYNAELFKQQQFGTAGVEAVNLPVTNTTTTSDCQATREISVRKGQIAMDGKTLSNASYVSSVLGSN